VPLNDRCCGESGTLAMTRPDISTQVRFRKEEEMRKGAEALRADGFEGEVKVLTSCPSCLQGLARFEDDAGTEADYIVVEMARHLLGENWMPSSSPRRTAGGIERAPTRCSRSSPTGTAPASSPGTTSTSWARTRKVLVAISREACRRRCQPRINPPPSGASSTRSPSATT
jgi:hypothetical protein